MFGESSPRPVGTLADRETLIKVKRAKKTGFTPRPVEQLVNKKLPRSLTNIECNHFLRSSTQEAAYGHPTLKYQLWLEAGKYPPPYPERPDAQFNSNIWRNFQKQYDGERSTDGQGISEMIAAMYPLNIPAPSQVGKYTYGHFLTETPLIKDPKIKHTIMEKTNKDVDEFKRMRLRSDLRNPPIDKSGKIIPPVNFQKYEHRLESSSGPGAVALPPPPQVPTRTDIMGQQVPLPKHQPHLWKFQYKLNNPQFEHISQALKKKQSAGKPQPSAFVTSVQ